MPITPTRWPSSSYPQNTTPPFISWRSSLSGMYGSFQRSAGITPLYARAASFIISQITLNSLLAHGRIMALLPFYAKRNADAIYCISFLMPFNQGSHWTNLRGGFGEKRDFFRLGMEHYQEKRENIFQFQRYLIRPNHK